MDSKCAVNEEEKLYLLSLLGNKDIVTELLYRGSEDGWGYEDFHKKCDLQGPTITLMKLSDGDCIGGATNT